jgi:hypothetical protein
MLLDSAESLVCETLAAILAGDWARGAWRTSIAAHAQVFDRMDDPYLGEGAPPGLAARFASGYLQAPPTAADLGASQAWAECYLPGAGWEGFDPAPGARGNVVKLAFFDL